MPDDPKPATPAAPEAPPQFPTDSSTLSTVYTNFCRVNVTPEELILDFGLNPQVMPTPGEPIRLTHRVVMSFYNAKRLMNALIGVISQYENTYGALEVDVQKRVRARPAFGTGGLGMGGTGRP